MTTNITINTKNKTLEISKKFATAASRFGSPEYLELKEARHEFPLYTVATITRKSSNKDPFRKLTISQMETYIKSHDPNGSIMEEFLTLRAKSEDIKDTNAASASYFEIKKWFIAKYSSVAKFAENREAILAGSQAAS